MYWMGSELGKYMKKDILTAGAEYTANRTGLVQTLLKISDAAPKQTSPDRSWWRRTVADIVLGLIHGPALLHAGLQPGVGHHIAHAPVKHCGTAEKTSSNSAQRAWSWHMGKYGLVFPCGFALCS